jgi:hypothetical protein
VLQSPELVEFYELCGGGYFGRGLHIVRIDEIAKSTDYWIEQLRDYDSRGDVLDHDRHCVFGDDAGGAPLICDMLNGGVATFWFEGGDWEPLASSISGFFDWLFSPSQDDADWSRLLAVIDDSQT